MSAPKPRRPRKRTEQQFQDGTVIPALRRLGYIVYHAHNARRSTPGLPDIIAAPPLHRPNWPVLALELKTGRYRLTPEQRDWLARLDGRTVIAAEMRPETMAVILRGAIPDLS